MDGSGQEEPKRDESPKDQSDTRCISRERSCHWDDVFRPEFGAGRGRGKVNDVTPVGYRSIGTYTYMGDLSGPAGSQSCGGVN